MIHLKSNFFFKLDEVMRNVQRTVVNSVVTGGVEDPFQRAYLTDCFRVQPELIDQIQLVVHQVE